MLIIEVSGGLGNQMFQYALYTKLKEMGKDVRLDLSIYKNENSVRKFELDIFQVDYQEASIKEIRKNKNQTVVKKVFFLICRKCNKWRTFFKDKRVPVSKHSCA